jgi:hypothetical protein
VWYGTPVVEGERRRRLSDKERNRSGAACREARGRKTYTTHEEFGGYVRRLGIPVRNVPPPPEERKRELFLFQGPGEASRRQEDLEEGE